MRNIKSRLSALEAMAIDDSCIVLECVAAPTAEQLTVLEATHKQGRMVILFIEVDNTIWRPCMPRPWECSSVN